MSNPSSRTPAASAVALDDQIQTAFDDARAAMDNPASDGLQFNRMLKNLHWAINLTRARARSAEDPWIAEGWKSVPINPNYAMRSAALELGAEASEREIWTAMLAVAPAPPAPLAAAVAQSDAKQAFSDFSRAYILEHKPDTPADVAAMLIEKAWANYEGNIWRAAQAAQPPADASPVDAKPVKHNYCEVCSGYGAYGDGPFTAQCIACSGSGKAAQPSTAQGDALSLHDGEDIGCMREQANAWHAVHVALTEVCPGWYRSKVPTTGIERAVTAIKSLAQRAASVEAKPVAWCMDTSQGLLFLVQEPSVDLDLWKPLIFAPPAPHVERDAALISAIRNLKIWASSTSTSAPIQYLVDRAEVIDVIAAMAAQQGEKGGA